MGRRMWDIALTSNEQEKATDDYIIGCLKCAAKHYNTMKIEDKYVMVSALAENLDKIRMTCDEKTGHFKRNGEIW